MKPVLVYALADYFGSDGLKSYALKRLQTLLDTLWVSEGFIDCIQEVYRSAVDPKDKMRNLVLEVTHAHLGKLGKEKRFQDLVRKGGDFMVDLIAKVVESKTGGW